MTDKRCKPSCVVYFSRSLPSSVISHSWLRTNSGSGINSGPRNNESMKSCCFQYGQRSSYLWCGGTLKYKDFCETKVRIGMDCLPILPKDTRQIGRASCRE